MESMGAVEDSADAQRSLQLNGRRIPWTRRPDVIDYRGRYELSTTIARVVFQRVLEMYPDDLPLKRTISRQAVIIGATTSSEDIFTTPVWRSCRECRYTQRRRHTSRVRLAPAPVPLWQSTCWRCFAACARVAFAALALAGVRAFRRGVLGLWSWAPSSCFAIFIACCRSACHLAVLLTYNLWRFMNTCGAHVISCRPTADGIAPMRFCRRCAWARVEDAECAFFCDIRGYSTLSERLAPAMRWTC
jgi:hypothetical protein